MTDFRHKGLGLGVSLLAMVVTSTQAYAQVTDATIIAATQMQSNRTSDGSATSNANSSTNQNVTGASGIIGGQMIEPVSIGAKTDGTSLTESLRPVGDTDLLDIRNPRLKPPAKPGEYEKWIQAVTGRKIKRFGADLLLPSNRDYAVPAVSTIPPDYALSVGDVVSIALTGSVEGSANFEIDRDGRIYLPNIGSVSLLGVRYRDLKEHVAAAIGRKYRGYEVSASIAKLRGLRVYVTGFANNPGAYTVNSLSTLVNAVLAAGGPNAGGSFRSVKLYRNGMEVVDFDLYSLLRKGDRSRDPVLQNEDVLFIPPAGQQIAVVGSVNEEAIYETRSGESLEDMLRIAGGPTNLADPSRVILYRLSDSETVGSRQIARSQTASLLVESGDIVQVLPQGSLVQPLDHQQVIVRIEGEVNRPGNYFVAPGTPLSRVMELAGGLTSRAYVYGTAFDRETVRAQQRKAYTEALDQMETALSLAPINGDRLMDATERNAQISSARSFLEHLRQKEPDGRLVLDLTPQTSELPGNLMLENNDHIIVPPRLDTVGVFGGVFRPASFLIDRANVGSVKDYIQQAGGGVRGADYDRVFVVRANGSVLTRQRGALAAKVLPGDVIFMPIKTQSSSILAKIRDITQILFQFGVSAAAISAVL